MSEATVATAVLDEIHRRGGWAIKTTGVSLAGCPDIIGAYRGRAIAWEIKQPGNNPTARQAHQLDRASRAGAQAEVVRSRTEARTLLNALDQVAGPRAGRMEPSGPLAAHGVRA